MTESAKGHAISRAGEITALDALLTAMFARLQQMDPMARIICSQIFEDAAQAVEARSRVKGADPILISALEKIESVREVALAGTRGAQTDGAASEKRQDAKRRPN